MADNSEDEKNLKALKKDPKKFLELCKTGHRANFKLETLSNHVQRVPRAYAHEMLKLFCSRTNPQYSRYMNAAKKDSGSLNLSSSKEPEPPLLAMKGIGRMGPFFKADSSLRFKFVELLPETAMSLLYFLFNIKNDESYEFESLFTTLLTSLVGFKDILGALVRDSAIRTSLNILWIEDDVERSGPAFTLTHLFNIFIQEYLMTIGNIEQGLWEILKLSASKGGHNAMIQKAIRQLHAIDSLSITEKNTSVILSSLQVLLVLSEEPPLCQMIVEGGGLAPVVKLSAFLFNTSSPRELLEQNPNFHIKNFFRQLFTIFKRLSMEIMECVSHLADAIDAGMIRVFAHACDSLDLLDKDTTFYITGILFRFTRLMLVHNSVLLSVTGEIKKLHTLPCAEKLTSGVLRSEWRAFQDASLVHFASLRYYEIVLSTTRKRRMCDTCQKVDFKDAFQCCSKCKNAFYCSKDCQLKAWKGGHKQQCSDVVGSRSKDVAGTKNISYLLALELKRHWPSIHKIPKVVNTPFSQLVFELDWTSMAPLSPKRFKVYTVDELMKKLLSEKDFVEVSMLKEMHFVTAGSRNTQAITRMVVITGFSTRTSYSSIGKTELISSDLERPNANVHFSRPFAKDDEDKDLLCIWDEVDEAIHRLGLPSDGTLLVENSKGKRVHAFSMIGDVLRSPTFPIPMNLRLAQNFEKFGL